MDTLKVADAEDVKLIRRLQNEIWLAERFEGWLTQLVMNGRQSLAQYDVRTSDALQGEDDGQETAVQPPANED